MIETWTPTYEDGYLDGACGSEAAVTSSPYIEGYNAGKRLRAQKQSQDASVSQQSQVHQDSEAR